MTPEELNIGFDGKCTDNFYKLGRSSNLVFYKGNAAERADFPLSFAMQPTLALQTQKVLFDEQVAKEVLPKLEVVYIFCTRSPWTSVWGMIETERLYKNNVAQGRKVRPIRFIQIEGANHFVSE